MIIDLPLSVSPVSVARTGDLVLIRDFILKNRPFFCDFFFAEMKSDIFFYLDFEVLVSKIFFSDENTESWFWKKI